MSDQEAIEIIRNEAKCVIRVAADVNPCNRDCKNCDLVMPTAKILEAYCMAVNALEDNKQC